MLPKKRSWRSFAPDADSLLAIRLAEEGGAPLAADRFMLLAVSECARDLPSDAASWDLSGLLVDGQPLRREVVLAWLHVLSQLMQSQPFSEPQQEPPLATSATGLAQLLSFADAVGSSDSVLKACLPPELEQLRFRVAAGGEHEVQLQAGGAKEAKAALAQQFASQLEALLYLAHRLELDSLAAQLHRSVRYNATWSHSLLFTFDTIIDPRVMSARVLEAAAALQAAHAQPAAAAAGDE